MYEQHAEMLAWDSAMAWAGVMEYAGAGAATHAEGVATSCPARAMPVSRLAARLHRFIISLSATPLHHKPSFKGHSRRPAGRTAGGSRGGRAHLLQNPSGA